MAALTKGDKVLVTGVNGFIGSHIADQLLARGLTVLGTVRSAQKGELIQAALQNRHKAAPFAYAVVPEMSSPRAFDEVVQGCQGLVHVASDLSFDPDPHKVVTSSINGLKGVLMSAHAAGVRRAVFTSSSTALYIPPITEEVTIDKTWWNDAAVRDAWSEPHTSAKAYTVYAASKTESEKAAWQFVRETKPGFVLNCVLPGTTFGHIMYPEQASTAGMVRDFAADPFSPKNQMFMRDFILPQLSVDVEDVALLHVIGLTEDDVRGERLFAMVNQTNYNSFLAVLRKIRPEVEWPEDQSTQIEDRCKVVLDREVELLRRYGRDGFVSYTESIKRTL